MFFLVDTKRVTPSDPAEPPHPSRICLEGSGSGECPAMVQTAIAAHVTLW